MGRVQKGVKEKRQREVYDLYFVERLTLQEIADKLDWALPVIWNDVQAIKAIFF